MIGERWGVSDAETRLAYPCDDFIEAPNVVAWRGVSVHVEPAVVWARLKQVRLAPYSYDLLDNLGRRSPADRRDLREPRIGGPFTRAFGRDQGTVASVAPGEHLTAEIMGAYLSYVVVPAATRTRLLLKVLARTSPWRPRPVPG